MINSNKDEERKKRIAEAQAYIQAREKAASKAAEQQSISVKAARQKAAEGITAEVEGKSAAGEQITVEESRAAQAEEQQRQQQEAQYFGERGALEPIPTEQTELVKPFKEGGFAEIEAQAESETLFPKLNARIDKKERESLNKLPPDARFRRASVLSSQNIKRDLLDIVDRSVILARATTEIVGDVPIIGDVVKGVFGSRSEKISNLKSSLDKRKELASSIAQDVKAGYIDQETGLDAIDNLEQQLNEAEQLIKEQVILSPAVRRSGKLEDIQVTMLQQRQAIQRARIVIASTSFVEADPYEIEANIDKYKNFYKK
jgi:hypothetical protein